MTQSAARALVSALLLGLALAVAWLVPMASVAVVWPILLVVPGWAVVAIVRPRVGLAGRLGLAIVLSVMLSTHLIHWLSHAAGGYGREVIFAVAAALALPALVAPLLGAAGPTRRALRSALPELTLACAAAAFVGLILAIGMWRVTPDGVYAGGTNWSDLGVHLSIAESLNSGGNFPPQVPYFAGVPLVYHWFADFHAAILAQAAGLFVVPAMVVQSALLTGALALLVMALARRLFHGSHVRRASLLAAALVVFGGGMGWIRFIGDLTAGLGTPLELIAASSYDNQWLTGWPYFRIPSVMGTGLLAHRATAAGLPTLVGAALLLVAGLPTLRARAAGRRDRPWLIGLAGVLGALLAPFHFFFFPVLPLLVVAWVLAGHRHLDRDAPRNAAIFLAPYALAVPFVLAPLVQAQGSGALQLVPGWGSAPFEDGVGAVLFFYATNLGVPFGLALLALARPSTPHRLLLGAWLASLFLVPNLVQVSVVDFDMNKYFQAMWIAVALLAAWLVRRWPAPALAAVLLLSVPSPLLVAAWTATSKLQVLSPAELAASRWVASETPPGSVFVTDGWVNSLTDPAGRLRLTTFGAYVANLGYVPDARIRQVHAIYCAGDPALSVELMRELGADYLVDDGRPANCDTPTDFAAASGLELAYENPSLRIWRLRQPVSSAP